VTTTLEEPTAPAFEPDEDVPRDLVTTRDGPDIAFRSIATGIGTVVLLVTGAIGVFLGYQMIPTLHHYGLHFFTENQWVPERNILGIEEVLLGTVEVALIALLISFPLALLTALYISEYAPTWARGWLVALVDLMAAIPSIIYGLWGLLLIAPHALFVARFLNEYLGWIPIFAVHGGDARAATFAETRFGSSAFIAGMVVSMMVIPMGCAVMRGVFAQAPMGEREAALALGSTRWGVVRAVVLPFGRGGIIGGTMLSLGRALGETIAVYLIVSPDFDVKFRPLEIGTITTASLIANFFGEATSVQLSALLAAGFVLFMMTLVVNTFAAIIVNRSRSGAMTEI
jgi:phosphate transport system permease protein